jgi:hypothetical protein
MLCEYCKIKECARKKSGDYKRFCCNECQWKYTVEKTKETNIRKYGTSNPMALDEVKRKRNESNLKKYGVENPFSLKEFQAKQRKTCLDRHGVEVASQSELIKEKIKDAWGKYENNHPFSDSNVREKREKTMNEKYGVSHPIQYGPIQERIRQTCLQKYGVNNASSSSEIKDKISSSLTSGNSEYLKSPEWLEQHVLTLGIRGVAEILNVSLRCVRKYCDQHKIDFRKKIRGSDFEHQVFLEISKLLPNTDIIQGDKSLIGKELDIFIPSMKLAIECNGVYWHSEMNGRGRSYHLNKSLLCAEKGVHLIHVWDNQWNNKRNLIISRLKSLLQRNDRVHARKCSIAELTVKDANQFLAENHIQGECSSSIRIGLFHNAELIAVMTFGKSRFSKKAEYELLRFCSKIGTNVIGGSSKLFKYFLRLYNPKNVISYSDKSFNTGKSYESLGFTKSHSSSPAYYYTKDYVTIENRIKYQKHKLKTLLRDFDPALSEYDNMLANGYDRIWDCGTDVWIFTSS